MFEFIHQHKRLFQIILAVLIVPPFALFGVDYYFRGTDPADQVARVSGSRISQQEFGQALRQREEQMRQMMGGKIDPALVDSPQMRRAVLNDLIEDRVLYTAAVKSGIAVPTAELHSMIRDVPAFKDGNGKFSAQRYRELLAMQGQSEGAFQADLRRRLIVGRSRAAFSETAFLPNAVVDRLYRLRAQQREISQLVLEPSQFAAKVKISPDEVKAYYEAHRAEFEVPEKIKLEFVVLTPSVVESRVTVTPKELQDYYQSRLEQLGRPEERRASHILVAVPASATPEQKAQAKEKAEALLKEARTSPKNFAELARKNSGDPGSAAEGGDLGYFARGKMVKPFDDAVFALKVGEIAGPVESQFGYHVIKLDAIKPSEAPSFDAAKAKLEDELKKSHATRAFAQDAEDFSNLIYDQPDSLKPVIEKFKLQPQTSAWMTRQGGESPLLNNEKFLRAAFSDNVLKNKQNTEAVEVAPSTLVAARVIAHEPAKQRALEEVQATIVQVLTQQKAAQLVHTEGEAVLAKLRKGEAVDVKWSPQQTVSRERPEGLQPEAARAVFRADASKLPAYAGVEAQAGRFVVYRISKVIDGDSIDPQQRQALVKQLSPLAGQEDLAARMSDLRQKADVKVDEKKIEKAG